MNSSITSEIYPSIVSIRVPPFRPADLELWFGRLKRHFFINSNTIDET